MNSVIKEIKKKKELSDLSDDLIKETLQSYLEKNKIEISENKKQQKILIKEIRAELRKYTGRFQHSAKSFKKRLALLNENRIPELLETHSSTKERIEDYSELISLIKSLNPKKILDLGCGINPIAIANSIPNVKYHSIDIKKDELKLIENYFKQHNVKGKVILADIRKMEKFPKADLCLILKTLDILETKNHEVTKRILEKLNCKHALISFSTRTLSGRPMNQPRRFWFENLLKQMNYEYTVPLRTKNEIFYLVRK